MTTIAALADDRLHFKNVCLLVSEKLKNTKDIHHNPNWQLFCDKSDFYTKVWIDCGYVKISDKRVGFPGVFWNDVANNLSNAIIGELPVTNHMITVFC